LKNLLFETIKRGQPPIRGATLAYSFEAMRLVCLDGALAQPCTISVFLIEPLLERIVCPPLRTIVVCDEDRIVYLVGGGGGTRRRRKRREGEGGGRRREEEEKALFEEF
jgi:hypothetical protein